MMNIVTNKRGIALVLIVLALAAVTIPWLYRSESCTAKRCIEAELSELEKLQRDMRSGALLVDVRSGEEFALGHAAGAINFSSDKIQRGEYPTDDKRRKLYLYCRSGRRAGEAAEALDRAGFTSVTNIGSLEHWSKIGGSVETGT